MLVTYIIINLLLYHLAYSFPVAIIVTPPRSATVIEGSTAEFTCTVIANEIDFFVNGDNSDESGVIDQGFTKSIVDITDTTIQQNFSAVAVASNNNTNITCRALTVEGTDVSINISDPAVLLLQGSLSSAVYLSYSFIDSSTINISWSPPFTLPGTDITGYNISATSNGTTTNYFTPNSYYELSLTDITDSPCNEIIITVSGYNGLDGENTSILISNCDSPIDTKSVPVLFSTRINHHIDHHSALTGELMILTLYLNVSSICYGQYPTHINLTIQYSNNGSLLTTIDNIPLVSTNDTDILTTTNDTIILLPVDNNYTAIISFSNLDFLSTISFSTYRALWFHSINTIGPSVVFLCHFYADSDAIGCRIELTLTNSTDDVQYNGTGNRTDDEAIVTINGVDTEGEYSTLVYEIKEDNLIVLVNRLTISIITSVQPYTIAVPISSLPLQNTYSSSIPSSSSSVSGTVHGLTNVVLYCVSIAVGIVLLSIIILTVSLFIYVYRRYQNSKNKHNLTTDINPAYINPQTLVSQLPAHGLVERRDMINIDPNPAYSHVSVVKQEKKENHVYENPTNIF